MDLTFPIYPTRSHTGTIVFDTMQVKFISLE